MRIQAVTCYQLELLRHEAVTVLTALKSREKQLGDAADPAIEELRRVSDLVEDLDAVLEATTFTTP